MARKYVYTHIYDTEAEAVTAKTLLISKFNVSIKNINIVTAPYGFILHVDTIEIPEERFNEIQAEIEPRTKFQNNENADKSANLTQTELTTQSLGEESKAKPKPNGTANPTILVPNATGPTTPKRKSAAVLLAVFLGLWSWLYTYQKDKRKFWINLIVAAITVGTWGIVSWVWAIVDTIVKPSDYYQSYPAIKTIYPKKAYFCIVSISIAILGGILFFLIPSEHLNIVIEPVGSGAINPVEGVYYKGHQTVLTATPASGYRFDYWSGDTSGTSNSVTVTMDGNKNIVAHFQEQYTLNISLSPDSGGQVTPTGDIYDAGANVILMATPASGYRFDYWSGDASGTSNSVTVTMDGNKNIVAHFKEQFTLNISLSPDSSGQVTPTNDIYDASTTVILTATPASGYRFDYWSGDASGTSTLVTVTMDGNKNITVHFLKQYSLDISISPYNAGKVMPTQGIYDAGSNVMLTATPASGYRFDHWSGDVSGTSTSVSITTNSNKVIIANFVPLSTTATLLFEDDFSILSSGWYTGTDKSEAKAFEDGEYSMLSKGTYTIVWQSVPNNCPKPQDFTAEVDVRKLSTAQDDSCGIAFRYMDNDNTYLFEICSGNGNFSISKRIKGNWITLTDWTYSSHISTGTNTNHLKVTCVGTKIEVYANDYKLTTITDSSFASGGILLATASYATPGSHHHFDNFKLYSVGADE